jgi:hypothetical protein
VPFCPLIVAKGFKYKKKTSEPILKKFKKEKRKRRSDADFEKEREDARGIMFDSKEEPEEDVVDTPDATVKIEDDCATSDAVSPQGIELSRKFSRFYLLLLKWMKCKVVVLGMSRYLFNIFRD